MDLIIAGNVQTVLTGHITEESLCPVSLDKIPYALGGAAIPQQNFLCVGETIVYEGIGHIFTVEKTWEEKRGFKPNLLSKSRLNIAELGK